MKCFVCNNEVLPKLILAGHDGVPSLLRCPACDVGFVYPQPSDKELTAYYTGMYSGLACEFDKEKMAWARNSVAEYSREAKINLEYKTVLDLGGGLGYYSKAFKERGARVTLVEPDPVSAAFAKQTLNAEDVFQDNIDTFLHANTNEYDVVFFRHVIEHCKDPFNTINLIKNCIKTGGIIIIETDNNDGVEMLFKPGTLKFYYNLYKSLYKIRTPLCLLYKRPFTLDPPRHLFGFRMKNLELMLERNNLIAFNKVHYRLGHPVYWPNLPLPRLTSPIKNISQLRFRQAFVEAVDIIFHPVRLVLEKMGMSSGICIYARKN